MKTAHWLTGFCFLCAAATAIPHPSSGIVVNERGEVFFVHSRRGLAKLVQTGELSYVRQCTEATHRESKFRRKDRLSKIAVPMVQ